MVAILAFIQLASAAGALKAAAGWLEEAIVSGRLVSVSLMREHDIQPPAPSPTPEAKYTAAPVIMELT